MGKHTAEYYFTFVECITEIYAVVCACKALNLYLCLRPKIDETVVGMST